MTRMRLIHPLSTRAAVLAALVSAGCGHPLATSDACAGETRVVVIAAEHRALLCGGGVAAKTFRVALGRGGVDKRVEGDRKTPLGRYALGEGRASKDFHLFLPVGYPTSEQREKGFTGAAIGMHGPARWSKRLGRSNGWFDWTSGCIAFDSDRAIDDVAAWQKEHPDAPIEIR